MNTSTRTSQSRPSLAVQVRIVTVVDYSNRRGLCCIDEEGSKLMIPFDTISYLPMLGERFQLEGNATNGWRNATMRALDKAIGTTPASRQQQLLRAREREFNAAAKATFEAQQRERAALLLLRNLRGHLDRAVPAADPSSAPQCAHKRRKKAASLASLTQRGLWKAAPVALEQMPRRQFVRDERPQAPLLHLSREEAQALWSN